LNELKEDLIFLILADGKQQICARFWGIKRTFYFLEKRIEKGFDLAKEDFRCDGCRNC
jgi:hypothetical protein